MSAGLAAAVIEDPWRRLFRWRGYVRGFAHAAFVLIVEAIFQRPLLSDENRIHSLVRSREQLFEELLRLSHSAFPVFRTQSDARPEPLNFLTSEGLQLDRGSLRHP